VSAAPLVVLGDVLLDVDVQARADRLVPDAPVPVLDELSRDYRPGGAALAATLAAVDGRRPVLLVAPLADDSAGARLPALLPPAVEVLPIPCRGRTPEKIRLRARGHTVARLDRNAAGTTVAELPKAVRDAVLGASAVLVSDYGGGVTRSIAVRAVLAERAARGATVWDPHPRGGEPVPSVTVVTPNAAEALAAAPVSGDGELAAVRRCADALLGRWAARSVAVTLGERGALLSYGTGASELFPAPATAAGDPCGAGDCFAASVTAALAAGALPGEAVAAAVAAASAFVAGGGAAGAAARGWAPARPSAEDRDARDVVAAVRARGGTVVATGGCFDLLHAGHVATLRAARSLGDCLVVCLNSDDSVRRIKGAGRPLQPARDRGRVLGALADVDAVVVFDEDTPAEMLRRLRPDVWVKGGDYAGVELPEARLLREWGGEVVTVPYLAGRSTSELVARATG
jgi:D-beta-D-heptose 7-phosphate kinase/D-beta-D-heptose 1-phosphate adenosyltransferase